MKPILSLIVCVGITCCVSAQDGSAGQTPEEFAKKVNKYLREHGAAVNEELKATREALAKVSADMEVQSRTIKDLAAKSQELERLISKLSMENARLKKDAAKLALALEEEQAKRASADLRLARAMKRAAPDVDSTESRPSPTPPSGVLKKYTVQRGDVLGNIAKAFNTTVEAIQRENNLKGTLIRPGQVLIIPER